MNIAGGFEILFSVYVSFAFSSMGSGNALILLLS
jgi:hypothetical protein